jgi:hypothetical protein
MGTCNQENWTDMPTVSTRPPGSVMRPDDDLDEDDNEQDQED